MSSDEAMARVGEQTRRAIVRALRGPKRDNFALSGHWARYRDAMPTYANPDAEHLAHGIRLGGGHGTAEEVERGLKALTVHDAIGTYTISTTTHGWLPGHYTTREAALVAVGYVLGGEEAGPLDALAQPRANGYTLDEIEAFAATT